MFHVKLYRWAALLPILLVLWVLLILPATAQATVFQTNTMTPAAQAEPTPNDGPAAEATAEDPLAAIEDLLDDGEITGDEVPQLVQWVIGAFQGQDTAYERVVIFLGVLFVVVFGVMSLLVGFLGYQNAKSIPANGLVGGGLRFLLTLGATLAGGTTTGVDDSVVRWGASLIGYEVVKTPDGKYELIPKGVPQKASVLMGADVSRDEMKADG